MKKENEEDSLNENINIKEINEMNSKYLFNK